MTDTNISGPHLINPVEAPFGGNSGAVKLVCSYIIVPKYFCLHCFHVTWGLGRWWIVISQRKTGKGDLLKSNTWQGRDANLAHFLTVLSF